MLKKGPSHGARRGGGSLIFYTLGPIPNIVDTSLLSKAQGQRMHSTRTNRMCRHVQLLELYSKPTCHQSASTVEDHSFTLCNNQYIVKFTVFALSTVHSDRNFGQRIHIRVEDISHNVQFVCLLWLYNKYERSSRSQGTRIWHQPGLIRGWVDYSENRGHADSHNAQTDSVHIESGSLTKINRKYPPLSANI